MDCRYYIFIFCTSTLMSCNGHWTETGSKCINEYNEAGVCKHFLSCSSAIKEVQKNGRPKICTFDGIYPIVCCKEGNSPDNMAPKLDKLTKEIKNYLSSYTQSDENNISVKKCREYYPAVKPKPLPPSNGFVGGWNAKLREYPFMALLGFQDGNETKWQCGGSLISEEFVLTAAHCLFSQVYGKVQYVRLGELDLNSTKDDEGLQDFTVKNTHPHPDYKPFSKYHDLALLQLNKPVVITAYVKPICLGVTKNLSETYPVGMGWGLLEYGGIQATILQSGLLAYVSNENCSKVYENRKDLKEGVVDRIQICADGGGERRDTCQGDSGGPLQILNYKPPYDFPEIVGVTSFGIGCAQVPGVYTRVYPYASWIEKVVWPDL